MRFKYYYQWLKFTTISPSIHFKNRLFIEKTSKSQHIYTTMGNTYKSFLWSINSNSNLTIYWMKVSLTRLFIYALTLIFVILGLYLYFNYNTTSVYIYPLKLFNYFLWRIFDILYFLLIQIQYIFIVYTGYIIFLLLNNLTSSQFNLINWLDRHFAEYPAALGTWNDNLTDKIDKNSKLMRGNHADLFSQQLQKFNISSRLFPISYPTNLNWKVSSYPSYKIVMVTKSFYNLKSCISLNHPYNLCTDVIFNLSNKFNLCLNNNKTVAFKFINTYYFQIQNHYQNFNFASNYIRNVCNDNPYLSIPNQIFNFQQTLNFVETLSSIFKTNYQTARILRWFYTMQISTNTDINWLRNNQLCFNNIHNKIPGNFTKISTLNNFTSGSINMYNSPFNLLRFQTSTEFTYFRNEILTCLNFTEKKTALNLSNTRLNKQNSNLTVWNIPTVDMIDIAKSNTIMKFVNFNYIYFKNNSNSDPTTCKLYWNNALFYSYKTPLLVNYKLLYSFNSQIFYALYSNYNSIYLVHNVKRNFILSVHPTTLL